MQCVLQHKLPSSSTLYTSSGRQDPHPTSCCRYRSVCHAGTTAKHLEFDREVAAFVGCDDAITFGMGFATNSVVIPALVGKGCLVLSDSLNHASIVSGIRGSGAKVKVHYSYLLSLVHACCTHCLSSGVAPLAQCLYLLGDCPFCTSCMQPAGSAAASAGGQLAASFVCQFHALSKHTRSF